jgi:hypothetical protein
MTGPGDLDLCSIKGACCSHKPCIMPEVVHEQGELIIRR